MPEPMPRPTRFLLADAFFGARTFERFIIALSCRLSACRSRLSLHDLHQVRNLGDHPANGGRVRALNHLIQPGKSQPLDHQLVLDRAANGGPHPLEVQFSAGAGFGLLSHNSSFPAWAGCAYNSSAALPRMAATSLLFFRRFRASKVALMTLCGLVVPIDLVSTFCTPAEVITARTAPPAITPVPSGAGFSSTIPDP